MVLSGSGPEKAGEFLRRDIFQRKIGRGRRMTRFQQSENPLASFCLRRRQCDVRADDHARKCQYRQHSGTVFSEQFHPFCHLFEDTDDVPSAMRGFRLFVRITECNAELRGISFRNAQISQKNSGDGRVFKCHGKTGQIT